MKAPYITVNNILSPNECEKIVHYGSENMERLCTKEDANPHFNSVTLRINDIDDSGVESLMLSMLNKTRKLILEFWKQEHAYIDLASISCWPTGMGLGAHADNIYYDTGQPNFVPFRTYSSVLYLNDDYKGGEFCWWDWDGQKLSLVNKSVPIAGSLMIFGAGIDYIHSVGRVKNGTRWTVPMWFTDKMENVPDVFKDEKYIK